MTYAFIALGIFTSLVKAYKLSPEDLRAMERAIMDGPRQWPVIKGTGGIRKMGFSPQRSSGGKSGGMRVCYLVIEEARHVYLFTLFAKKNDAADLTPDQTRKMAALVRDIKDSYRRGKVK